MPTFTCPMCGGSLLEIPGQRMDPRDGVSLLCPHKTCPAQEVMGHGGNVKEAYAVIQHRFPNKNPSK